MTNQSDRLNILPGQQPAGEVGRLDWAREHAGDTDKSYGLAFYGMWVSVGWTSGQQQTKAGEPGSRQDADVTQGRDTPSETDTLHTGDEHQPSKSGQTTEEDNLKQGTDEGDAYLANAGSEPSVATAGPAAAPGDQETQAVGNSGGNDTTGQMGAGAQSLSTGNSEISVPDTGPLALHSQDTQPAGEQGPTGFAAFTDFQAFQHFVAYGSESIALETSAFASGNLTVITGDYHDIQISFDFGSFNSLAMPASGMEISFGSVLHSPASEYDLVMIDQDLVEINVIVQHNIGAVGTSATALDMQSNQAAIVDYADDGGLQVTMGDMFNVASVQQLNYLAGVSSATQINDAAILDGGGGNASLDEYSVPFGEYDTPHDDALQVFGSGADFSALHVTGTYYEINLIYQVSALAAQDGGGAQFNSAVINDFDDVAVHQFVGGDEYDLNAISQVNYLSQVDQLVPFSLSDFFPDAGWMLSAGPIDNTPTAVSPVDLNPATSPMFQPPDIGAQSGDAMNDLIAL